MEELVEKGRQIPIVHRVIKVHVYIRLLHAETQIPIVHRMIKVAVTRRLLSSFPFFSLHHFDVSGPTFTPFHRCSEVIRTLIGIQRLKSAIIEGDVISRTCANHMDIMLIIEIIYFR